MVEYSFKRESKYLRPAMSATEETKAASVVDKLFSAVSHDHPTQSRAAFGLIFS